MLRVAHIAQVAFASIFACVREGDGLRFTHERHTIRPSGYSSHDAGHGSRAAEERR